MGVDSLNSRWELKVFGTVSLGIPATRLPGKSELLSTVLDRFVKGGRVSLVGPVGKAMAFEIRNAQTGETSVFTFSGGGLGAGFGSAQASLSGWTSFETENSISLRDFTGTGRLFNAGVGLGLGVEFGGIVFHGINLDWGSFLETLWHNNSVPTGGFTAGTAVDLSEVFGGIVMIGYQASPDSDVVMFDESGMAVIEPAPDEPSATAFDMLADVLDEPDGSFDMEADAAQSPEFEPAPGELVEPSGQNSELNPVDSHIGDASNMSTSSSGGDFQPSPDESGEFSDSGEQDSSQLHDKEVKADEDEPGEDGQESNEATEADDDEPDSMKSEADEGANQEESTCEQEVEVPPPAG